MAESEYHIRLVEALAGWISGEFLKGDTGCLFVDSPSSPAECKPPNINGFIPDVYIPYDFAKVLVIGEAKTSGDLETSHTQKQIEVFLTKCAYYEGSTFVLAVPWDMVRLAVATVNEVKALVGAVRVRTVVLEKLAG